MNAVEAEMANAWTDKHLIPLRESVRYYGVKKRMCMDMIAKIANPNSTAFTAGREGQVQREVLLESPDGTLRGYADAIWAVSGGEVIGDYKTGQILAAEPGANELAVKEDYQLQLKLYAALYEECRGRWPVSLLVLGLDGKSYNVLFASSECRDLLADARGLLREINTTVVENAADPAAVVRRLAAPSPDNCRFCSFRPVCASYWTAREASDDGEWPHDAKGAVLSKFILGNGLTLVKLGIEGQTSESLVIRGLHPDRHPALRSNAQSIAAFSVVPDAGGTSFREGQLTTIYDLGNREARA